MSLPRGCLPSAAWTWLGLAGLATTAVAGPQPQLTFISERNLTRDVYVIAADRSGERILAGGPADESNGPSTPDGSQVLVTSDEAGGRSAKLGAGESGQEPERRFAFRLVALSGKSALARPPLLLPREILRSPSFFPEGRHLIFESEPESGSGLREILALRLDAGSPPPLRQLTRNPEGNFSPTVCGRSGYIAFTSSRDRTSEIYRMRLDGSELRRLTYVAGSKRTPRCSATGEQIFFISDHEGADRIYSVHRNGSTPQRLTGRDLDPTWIEDEPAVADDGIYVAYTLRRAGRLSTVHIVNRQRRSACEVALPPSSAASQPDWSPPLAGGPKLAITVEKGAASESHVPLHASAAIFTSSAACADTRLLTVAQGPNWHPLWIRK